MSTVRGSTPKSRLFVRSISYFDPKKGRDIEVSREVSKDSFQRTPQKLPPDAVVTTSAYSSSPSDKERRYLSSEKVDSQGRPCKKDYSAPLFLSGQETVQYSGNSPAVLFQEELKTGPDSYNVQVLPGATERARYVNDSGSSAHELAALIRKEVENKTHETVRAWDRTLKKSRGEFLEKRYGERTGLSVLEIGPGTTGVVPRALLNANNDNRYTGVDVSPDALRMQRDVLVEDGLPAERMSQVVGDYRGKLPVSDSSQDLVLGFASIGLWDEADKVKGYFDEFARVLKPGGEMLVGGVGLEYASPVAIAGILKNFELVPQREAAQSVDLILRRRQA